MIRVVSILYLALTLSACSSNETIDSTFGRCVSCHVMAVDKNHSLSCTTCHRGIDTAKTEDRAHQGLIGNPAHPQLMAKTCLPCHENITQKAPTTVHFTLSTSTNMFRKAFGAQVDVSTFADTSVVDEPSNSLELADDLLRRRCFKCHLYDSGQGYPATSHGQGCAACHLPFSESKLEDHSFSAPTDKNCLSCHYGNYVGFDYYGRFEHDFNVEYRTPYTTKADHFRPYGVEYHPLKADIHQQKGLSCTDCHTGDELMLQGEKPSCRGCHDTKSLETQLPEKISKKENSYVLTSHTGNTHLVPTLEHSAHYRYEATVSCQACHAQWSFDDREKHFIRIDNDELDNYSALTVQGNYEIESLLTNNFDYDKDELPIIMTDSLTGKPSIGIWLKGFVTRRWENVTLGRDHDGVIKVFRPILDYTLSWIDEDETVRLDAVHAKVDNNGLRPYTPHTTGSAGLFYEARIQQFLNQKKRDQTKNPEPQITTGQ